MSGRNLRRNNALHTAWIPLVDAPVRIQVGVHENPPQITPTMLLVASWGAPTWERGRHAGRCSARRLRRGPFVHRATAGDPGRSVGGARSIWVNHGQHIDALTLLAVAGQHPALRGCRLGTAVLPVYGRDPKLFARQVASVQAAVEGPLSIGLGASHPTSPSVSPGLVRSSPLRDVREFVEATRAQLSAVAPVIAARSPGIYLSTGGPKMLEMAVSIGVDGVLSTLTTPQTYHDVFLPSIARHVAATGHPAPEVMASEHVCLTDDPEGCLARLASYVSLLDSLVRYQAVMAHQGLRTAAETFVIGNEQAIRRRARGVSRCRRR
jgi:alkanesulfonate monooxygenase SsuD/methylene tetrahydromethanopterin reductase-like flavin-dependent oxidoreductase (luciferase family)